MKVYPSNYPTFPYTVPNRQYKGTSKDKTMIITCSSCKGIGEEKVISNNPYIATLPHKAKIRKCGYCASINIRPARSDEAINPPSWYRETIVIDGVKTDNIVGLSLFALK